MAAIDALWRGEDAARFAYEHVFLPPNLPQSDHDELGADFLLQHFVTAAEDFSTLSSFSEPEGQFWRGFSSSLVKWRDLYSGGAPCSDNITQALQNMMPGEILLIPVVCQNATLLIRNNFQGAIVECFEVLATTESVMAAKDAVIRRFPARAIFLRKEVLDDKGFVEELGKAIFQLSVEKLELAMETSTKGGQTFAEERDSAHPRAVTEWLFSILSTRGEPVSSQTILKRTHDDVCWTHALRPWRRSNIYLSARVGVQLALLNSGMTDSGYIMYKNFMLYLVSQIATEIVTVNIAPDVLHVLRVKIARRNAKLGPETIEFVQEAADKTLQLIDKAMQRHWVEIKAREDVGVPNIPVSSLSQYLNLKCSGEQLRKVWDRSQTSYVKARTNFTPKGLPRLQFSRVTLPSPTIFNKSSTDLLSTLNDFERWVAENLESWLVSNSDNVNECATLNYVIVNYHRSARSVYQEHPQLVSVMFLTMFELWAALDKITTTVHPLLLDFPPDIDIAVFRPLLLSTESLLKRLAHLETYIQFRSTRAMPTNPSIFGNPSRNCLASRFYDQSPELAVLRAVIEDDAQEARTKKQEEWDEQRLKHHKLVQQAASLKHSTARKLSGMHNPDNCHKCSIEKEASSLKFEKHEWPLPAEESEIKAVVFELGMPEELIHWRDGTWYLVHDLGRVATHGQQVLQPLFSYRGLREYGTAKGRRVTLASALKATHKTHYFRAGAALGPVSVGNGLKFAMCDSWSKVVWTASQRQKTTIRQACASKLPDTLDTLLGPLVHTTSHSHNSVIVKQTQRPAGMSAPEYILYGTVRSGERLQWINILTVLRSHEIDLNSISTALLLLHASSEVGAPGTIEPRHLRDCQGDLNNDSFCYALLEALSCRLKDIETSWKETTTAAVILTLTLALSSLAPRVVNQCIELVLRIRRVGLAWIRQLAQTYTLIRDTSGNSVSHGDLPQNIIKSCILARRTYATVWNESAPSFDRESVEDYIEISIHLHAHLSTMPDENGLDSRWASDILQDSHNARFILMSIVEWLDLADEVFSRGIKRYWGSASFEGKWNIVHQDDVSWITNQSKTRPVHLNLVTGSLLISGKPLSRLPFDYRSNPLYRAVFADLELFDVIASDVEDMEYMSRYLYEGHQVYFGMRMGELVLRSHIDDERYEAVLPSTFHTDLPAVIVRNTIPWMSLRSGTIEFRSREKPWDSSAAEWFLYSAVGSDLQPSLHTKDACLIDYESPAGITICQILRSIERRDHIVISKPDKSSLEVWLPRFHLHFHVTPEGHLKCKELSAVVDQDQSIGTLHGLQSRLVLRTVGEASGSSSSRTVLVPLGEVQVFPMPPHVHVVIVQSDDDKTISFTQLRVDDRLGRLLGTDLDSHIYKTYLHALTGFPEPDSLTGRTGTEQCLLDLSDTITRTTVPLSHHSRETLTLIAGLSPTRKWYPDHKQVMQSYSFHEVLSGYVLRDIFFLFVMDIFEHNAKAGFLSSNEMPTLAYSLKENDLLLLHRSHHRTRKLYPTDPAWNGHDDITDRHYTARDEAFSESEAATRSMATLVHEYPSSFPVGGIKERILRWGAITGLQESFNPSTISEVLHEDLNHLFPRLLYSCKRSKLPKQQLVFILSLLAFKDPTHIPLLKALLAVAVSPFLKHLPLLDQNSYDLREENLFGDKAIDVCWTMFEEECVNASGPTHTKRLRKIANNFRQQLQPQLKKHKATVSAAISTSWMNGALELPQKIGNLDMKILNNVLRERFSTWRTNRMFLSQLDAFDRGLEAMNGSWIAPAPVYTILAHGDSLRGLRRRTHFSLLEVMHLVDTGKVDFVLSEPSLVDRDLSKTISAEEEPEDDRPSMVQQMSSELEDLISDLTLGSDEASESYAQQLHQSIQALQGEVLERKEHRMKVPDSILLDRMAKQIKGTISRFILLCNLFLKPRFDAGFGLVKARLWPQATPFTILQLLSPQHRNEIPGSWLELLVSFAHEVTALQRIGRIQYYLVVGDDFALQRELANPAHAAWTTTERLDWLLLEIQNNFLIRPVQVKVAQEIIKPENGLVLLGMGEGKTSVILPMVVSALATGSNLVRVVVLKPLANEMLRQLSRTLSGLCSRMVYFLPFSRSTKLSADTPGNLLDLYKECRQQQGVLLSLPEHLNSFRLIGFDQLATHGNYSAAQFIKVQRWLDQNARDVLDESDELLKPSYELIYTNGQAKPLSGAPGRWTVTLQLLNLIKEVAHIVHQRLPLSLEFESRDTGEFPHIRILKDEGGVALRELVVEKILQGNLPCFPIRHCNADMRHAIRTFLLDVHISRACDIKVSQHFHGTPQESAVYILRGLTSHEIITHALCKRWMVNYGLDRSRSLAAVPYRAKAVPSASAEFAQPEMMIALTALAWLYTGLERKDLLECITILLRTADPSHEYEQWVRQGGLPEKYHSFNCINLDDSSLLDYLYGSLRKCGPVVEFFLEHVVFPTEAKEFSHKFSSSSWDLCSTDGGKITSGFSGTCDSRVPLTCFQKDLEGLRHSTALTLTTLLRQNNRRYVCAASPSYQRLTTEGLLEVIAQQQPTPSVLIDVGAQILDQNKDVAAKWLAMRTDKLAAIFFNDKDEKMVMNRDGTVEPLLSSIFKDDVGRCLLYLDEFHTRGTDFRLPDQFHAGILLGPGLLKDTLVQGAMRMRKLAVSQTVSFFAPPEVDSSIRTLMKDAAAAPDSADVLRWVIYQSCESLKRQQRAWAVKGLLHRRRQIAISEHMLDTGKVREVDSFLSTIRERESRTVSELYGVSISLEGALPFNLSAQEKLDTTIQVLQNEWEASSRLASSAQNVDEEQEREVLHEVEQEREVEKDVKIKPANPKLCRALLPLVETGNAPNLPDGLYPAFEILTYTSIADKYVRHEWPFHVIVTVDFMRTVMSAEKSSQDEYLRPVQWVLKAKYLKHPVIISPHEANSLLPTIRKSKKTTLFLYQARTSKAMKPFDSMSVYRVPESASSGGMDRETIVVLNLFAGQLYFSTFEDYQLLCGVIGLWDGQRSLPNKTEIGSDNFVSPACREANEWTHCTFKKSPVQMLTMFMDMRRLGIGWGQTHVGRILTGYLLRRDEFD
ncbi:hypothetical protein PV08_02486 [Exophiala spinifera]|uniref:ubiquitinyl hydrolase 1 n=1 Tax=Exophiala spinifera TaxID=91928 RepID=A0A0D2BGR5_9EURO|nr:uncharacterized protein PV08_02486 [Exophiala spinifera]KIW18198.1 hypothetical protein PV08_02486 [Exophiala spinifera]